MPSSRPRKIPNQRWEKHRSTIQRLYLKRTLQDEDDQEGVISYMSRVHGFYASLSQYEARLKDWGIRKNLMKKHWIAVKNILDQRDAQNKQSAVYISGKLLENSQVRKGVSRPAVRNAYSQNNQPSWLDIQLPSYLEIRSPELSPQREEDMQEDATDILECGTRLSTPCLVDEESLEVVESSLLPYDSGHTISIHETQFIYNDSYVMQTRVTSPNTEWTHLEAGLDILCQEGIKRAIYASIPSDTLSCITLPPWNLDRLERAEIRDSLQRIPRTSYINSIKSMIPARHSSNLADMTQGASILRIAIYELVNQTFRPRQECSEPVKWIMQYSQRNESSNFFEKLKGCLHSPSLSDAVYRNLFLAAMSVNASKVMNNLITARNAPKSSMVSSVLSKHNYASEMTAILFRGPSELVANTMACCDHSTISILKRMVKIHNNDSKDSIYRQERFKVLPDNAKLLQSQGFDLNWPNLVEAAVRSGDSNIVKRIISLVPYSQYIQLFKRDHIIIENGHGSRVFLSSIMIRNLSEEDTIWTFRTLVHYLLSIQSIIGSSSAPGEIISTGLPNPFRSKCQKSTLELAIAREYDSVVEYLISQGAQVTAGCLYQATCLKRLSLIEQFLDAGVSPFETIVIDESDYTTSTTPYAEALRTMYHEAIHLFDQQSQFTPGTNAHHTILIAASEIGDCKQVTISLEALKYEYIDFTKRHYRLESSLQNAESVARKHEHWQILAAMFEGGAIPAVELFEDAIVSNDRDRIEELFERTNGTVVHGIAQAVARLENKDFVQFILECIDIQEIDYLGEFLKQAILLDNEALVENLLHIGVSPNSSIHIEPYDSMKHGPTSNYISSLETPLIVAIRRKNKTIVDLLLKNFAILNPELREYIHVSKISDLLFINYIQHGYKPRFVSALEAAASVRDTERIHDLISRGADPYDSNMIIELGKFENHEILGSIFLGEALKVTPQAKNVLPALAEALSHGRSNFAQLLLPHADLEHLFEYIADASILHYQDDDVPNDYHHGFTLETNALGGAIHNFAQKNWSLGFIHTLLRSGSDPNSVCLVFKRRYGATLGNKTRTMTPLNHAVFWNSKPLLDLLIKHGAKINGSADNLTKRTPLQLAAELGHLDMVSHLIDLGAEVNSPPTPCKGFTALQLAAKQGFYRIAEVLLEHKAVIDWPAARICGRTAFEAATENGRLDMMLLLVRNGADLISSTGSKQFERAIQFAEARGEKPAIMLAHELREIVQRVTVEAQDEAFKSLLDKVFEC